MESLATCATIFLLLALLVGVEVRADLGNGAMGSWIGGEVVVFAVDRGATVRKRMGPEAPTACRKVVTFVGELGLSATLPPPLVVKLLGLTMRTIEGAAPAAGPFPEELTPWPLLESKMILLPGPAVVEVAAVATAEAAPGATV